MGHDWMIRTLEDLQRYATLNGFDALADHLQQGCLLAQVEIANLRIVPRDAGKADGM